MRDFFHPWQRKAQQNSIPDRVLSLVARRSGISIDELTARLANKDLKNMDSLALVELVAEIEDDLTHEKNREKLLTHVLQTRPFSRGRLRTIVSTPIMLGQFRLLG